MVGHQRRLAYAQVGVRASRDVAGYLGSLVVIVHWAVIGVFGLVARFSLGDHHASSRRPSSTQSTKMPGVTTASGSRPPTGTVAVTSTIVSVAAVAMTGPKLRVVLRNTRLPSGSARWAPIRATSPLMGYSRMWVRPSMVLTSLPSANGVPTPVGQ